MKITKTAVVLQGGGALGAYEVGVLKALYELRSKNNHEFKILVKLIL